LEGLLVRQRLNPTGAKQLLSKAETLERVAVIKYIHPVKIGSAQGLVGEIYAQIKRDFGRVVEPFALHSPLPKLLAGAWMACRETELAGSVPRSKKEAVAAAISVLNRCPYCVDAHSIMLDAAGEHAVADSLNHGRYSEIKDAEMRSVIQWALNTKEPEMGMPRLLSLEPNEEPEIIGTAVFYHYINRVATVLLSETPLPSNNTWLKGPFRRIAGRMFARAVGRPKTAGESLKFLPEANLPADLQWAEANRVIAQAFARFSAVIDEVGEQAMPLLCREHVEAFVGKWRGESISQNRQWIDYETEGFVEPVKSMVQLAMLAAVAPWQVDERRILMFRKYFPEERVLLSTLAWGSFTAARRIGTWM
jgi:AhpD family alkylhydroperoxidase